MRSIIEADFSSEGGRRSLDSIATVFCERVGFNDMLSDEMYEVALKRMVKEIEKLIKDIIEGVNEDLVEKIVSDTEKIFPKMELSIDGEVVDALDELMEWKLETRIGGKQ